jgi:hypothetical protein
MGTLARQHPHAARTRRKRSGHNPLLAPLMVFAMVVAVAAIYVGYVLWPRWPQAQVALDAPAFPIVVAGSAFNIEPAAIRMPVQRRPGTQDRVDLNYLWPSLTPPDPAVKEIAGEPVNPNERLFVTIQNGEITMPLMERVQNIYPRYLVAEPTAGPEGLTLRAFRDGTPYQGEDLVFESQAPELFLARCTRKGVVNSGGCLLERRVGDADITIRFPRDWLSDWQSVARGIDQLMARLHPDAK